MVYMNEKLTVGHDVCGNIAILKFDRRFKARARKVIAMKFIDDNPNVRTVVEYGDKFKGRLRTHTTKYLAGEKTKEALYKENGCLFRFNVDTCYFSPRLSAERKELAEKVKKKESVLVMFGGVAPFGIVIAKLSKCKRVVSVELGRECTKYARINVKRNKLENVEIIGGDVCKRVPELKGKFDRIVMARPNLRDSFLDVAFRKIMKGGLIHYYGFYEEKNVGDLKDLVNAEARKARKRVKIQKIKKAGDVGPYRFRYRIDFRVLG